MHGALSHHPGCHSTPKMTTVNMASHILPFLYLLSIHTITVIAMICDMQPRRVISRTLSISARSLASSASA
jgi:hypothetical protein